VLVRGLQQRLVGQQLRRDVEAARLLLEDALAELETSASSLRPDVVPDLLQRP
jgi:hypothetical protein